MARAVRPPGSHGNPYLTTELDAGGILVHAHAEGTTNVRIRSGTRYVWELTLTR